MQFISSGFCLLVAIVCYLIGFTQEALFIVCVGGIAELAFWWQLLSTDSDESV